MRKTWCVLSGPDRTGVRVETFEEARDLAATYEQEGRPDVLVVDHLGTEWTLAGMQAAALFMAGKK